MVAHLSRISSISHVSLAMTGTLECSDTASPLYHNGSARLAYRGVLVVKSALLRSAAWAAVDDGIAVYRVAFLSFRNPFRRLS